MSETYTRSYVSVRRPRAWRRGRMLPIWQGSLRIRPLHRLLDSNGHSKIYNPNCKILMRGLQDQISLFYGSHTWKEPGPGVAVVV